MNIENNNMLFSDSKYIEIYNTCVIAKDGPNMVGKMSLDRLSIPYDSFFTTRMTLQADNKYHPIMYGELGSNVTFLVIKPNYSAINPQVCSGSTGYLQYYFEDNPLVIRYITDLMILSGDENHRIPQIYLYNPNNTITTVDIMCANMDINEISQYLVPQYTEIKGLSYMSVITDQIYGINSTGSTQFEILDINGNQQLVIPYNKIDIIDISNDTLTITTRSIEPVKLIFLSSFNANQAISRMNWVMTNTYSRYLTKTYPGIDTVAPVITFNSVSEPLVIQNNSGLTREDIIDRYIYSVEDYDNNNLIRDGIISKYNVDILIYKISTGEQLTGITGDGDFNITFIAEDVAQNTVSYTKELISDSVAPIIYFLTSSTTNRMDLTGNTMTPGTIYKDDIRRFYLDYVWDNVDGVIANSSVTLTIIQNSNTYTYITSLGYYDLNFSVTDRAGNIYSINKELRIIESYYPNIIYTNKLVGTGFTMSLSADTSSGTGVTIEELKNYTVSAITDICDGNINLSNLYISGVTFPITTIGYRNIIFSVSNQSDNITTEIKGITLTL
jgi:hypothetical protein